MKSTSIGEPVRADASCATRSALCASFFFCLMVNYVAIQLRAGDVDATDGGSRSRPPAARWRMGRTIGGVVGRRPRGARDSAAGIARHDAGHVGGRRLSARSSGGHCDSTRATPCRLMVMLLLTGGLLNAVQTTMYALAAHVYPTEIRSTGVGSAVAFGRIGNVLAVYVGGYALDQGGPPGYFTSWAF